MLTKKDVENILDRADDGANWQYWRDSGTMHCWSTTDLEWLLQISHERNVAAICDLRKDGYEMAAGEYTGDHTAVKLVALAGETPQTAFEHLSEQHVTTTDVKIVSDQA